MIEKTTTQNVVVFFFWHFQACSGIILQYYSENFQHKKKQGLY